MDATDPFLHLMSSLLFQYSSIMTENQQLRARFQACTGEIDRLSANCHALERQLAHYEAAPAPPAYLAPPPAPAPAPADTLEPSPRPRPPTPRPFPPSWTADGLLFRGNGVKLPDANEGKKEDRAPRPRASQ
jgi:hypothetical protein